MRSDSQFIAVCLACRGRWDFPALAAVRRHAGMRTTDAVTQRLVLILQVLVDSYQLCLAPVQQPHGRCACVVQEMSVWGMVESARRTTKIKHHSRRSRGAARRQHEAKITSIVALLELHWHVRRLRRVPSHAGAVAARPCRLKHPFLIEATKPQTIHRLLKQRCCANPNMNTGWSPAATLAALVAVM
jgi:hypothetical protein